MCPILRQTIYSLMPLLLEVARPLTGVNWITIGLTQPFFIAGGLNEDNVVKAIQHFTPYAGRCIKLDWRRTDKKIMKRLEDL